MSESPEKSTPQEQLRKFVSEVQQYRDSVSVELQESTNLIQTDHLRAKLAKLDDFLTKITETIESGSEIEIDKILATDYKNF